MFGDRRLKYYFVHWIVDGEIIEDNPATVNLSADSDVKAVYVEADPKSYGTEEFFVLIHSNEENRQIDRATDSQVVCQGEQNLVFYFTFSRMKKVEQIIHVELETKPEKWIIRGGQLQHSTLYSGNIIGLSLNLTVGSTILDCINGTTITAIALATGF
jgi:hypothetical protein